MPDMEEFSIDARGALGIGKSIRERAKALIAIAAPQFREQLEIDFKKYYDSMAK